MLGEWLLFRDSTPEEMCLRPPVISSCFEDGASRLDKNWDVSASTCHFPWLSVSYIIHTMINIYIYWNSQPSIDCPFQGDNSCIFHQRIWGVWSLGFHRRSVSNRPRGDLVPSGHSSSPFPCFWSWPDYATSHGKGCRNVELRCGKCPCQQ